MKVIVPVIPFQKHEVEEYERKRYRGWDQKLVDRRERKILRKILKKMKENSPLVLDIPCGYGRFSSLLVENGFSLVNSDLSFHMVKRVMEKNSRTGGVLGVVADAKKGLPFKQNAIDFFLSMRFFHHIHEGDERTAVLKEYFRIASEGVILSYYEINFFHSLQRKVRRKIKRSRTRIKMISRTEFQREVEQVGFHIEKIFPLFRGVHAQNIALLRKR